MIEDEELDMEEDDSFNGDEDLLLPRDNRLIVGMGNPKTDRILEI